MRSFDKVGRALPRLFVRAVVFVCALSVGLVLGTAAWAGVDQDGRQTDSNSVDGTYAYIVGNGFYTPSNACTLYAILVNGDNRQVETGLLRCVNTTVDGSCYDDRTFAERYAGGSNYFCVPGDHFNNGDSVSAYIERDSSSPHKFTGWIPGTSISQSEFDPGAPTSAYAWGEVTGGNNCPTSNDSTAHFHDWNKKVSGTFSYADGSSKFRGSSGMPAAPCWSTISSIANGDFHVDH